jgi:hypothetical protein
MKYYIARRKYFYGKHRTKWHLGFNAVVFASRAEALEAITNMENRVYYLSHNESCRPDLKVVSESQLTQGMLLEARDAR